MRHIIRKAMFMIGLVAAAWAWNGDILPTQEGRYVATAEARVGRPVTPVSYAGVARRSTVRPGRAGVTRGVGAGARGVGVAPGNRGGPVNRVGRR